VAGTALEAVGRLWSNRSGASASLPDVRFAILFGAGASYGCGTTRPHRVPLGKGLYDELRSRYPETWGSQIKPDEDAAFRQEPPFESDCSGHAVGSLWVGGD